MHRFSIVALALLAGCMTGAPDMEKPDVDDTKTDLGKGEAWSSADAPSLFSSSLEFRLASLPQQGEATSIPWPGSYWPVYEDSINYRWDGASSDSPAKKYEKAFGGTGVEDAVSQYHGIDANKSRTACTQTSDCDSKLGESCAKRAGQSSGTCIPTWWGICHAWTPAAILLPEPKYPVTYNGVTFKVSDIKALITLVHNRTNTRFVSLRCNKDNSSNEIHYDDYGRPTAADAECRDTNPGTYHVLLANYLGINRQAFAEDRTFDDQVWNQPLRGYRVIEQREVSAAEANRMIGVTSVGGTTVTRSGTVAKDEWAHQGSFPVTAGQTVKVVMTGDNDADLYVKFGAAPTASAYDCRPYAGGSSETCELTAPAGATAVYVSVQGYAASSTFNLSITTGGSAPVDYQFNPDARSFFYVHSEVYYISESSASTDGNLASRIDQYTHTDGYEYILELDADGKIIGGEWLGGSKQNHPDFVWLPLSAGSSSVAGGKITYAKVKMIYDMSMQEPGGGSTGGEETVTDAGTIARGAWKQYGPFHVAEGATLTAVMTGDNDADLYVRKGAAPTSSAYDCRPYKSGSSEQCSVTGPGDVYVAVNGYAASSSFQLTITYLEGTGGGTTPPPPATFQHLNETGSLAQGEMKVFQLPIPAGQKVVVRTQAPNDVDLYLQMNAAPTRDAYLMRAWTTSGNETLIYTATSSGTLYVAVDGYAASSFTLTTADN